MKIWIDADAAPKDVKNIVAKAALRLEVPCLLVANHRLQPPANNPFVETVRVDGGPDVADDHIADHAEPGDLAITADIPLASRLVEKGVRTIDPRGTEYTPENIGERLSVRDFMDQLRSTGVETGGPKAWGPKDKQAFAASFDRVLTKLVREAERRARS
ncbi:MAG: YaiI/YqxD family protein [Gemmatimonadota bacterium]